jgi:Cu2+-exporting ATPase
VTWRLGRAGWAVGGAGDGATIFARDGVVLAELRFREEIRPLAIQQVRALREAGYGIALLSGDHPDRVRAMADKLGLPAESALGGLSPDAKAARVRALSPAGVLMIGDGANDSLAFDAALCRGTPAVTSGLLEQKADFYLMGRSLGGLEHLLQAAQRHGRITFRVFAFAVTYNAAAIACALAGLMNPLVAAIIMPLSSLVSLSLVLFSLHRRPVLSTPTTLQPIHANA